MKKIFFLSFFSVVLFSLSIAQSLQYTKWKKYDTTFNDTLTMHFHAGDYIASTSAGIVVSGVFTVNGSVITFQDLSGPSACFSNQIGTYGFSILNNILHFDLVSDHCTGRSASLNASEWVKMPESIIYVPADYSTIQQGINAATPGDTVLVAEGRYYEQINFKGKKPLLVASLFSKDGDTSHIRKTIIDGSQLAKIDSASVVYFISKEDTTSILCGFTITRGKGTQFTDGEYKIRLGGGICIGGSGARIMYNHITENHLSDSLDGSANIVIGAGLAGGGNAEDHWIVVDHNVIDHNSCFTKGLQTGSAGLEIDYSCRITNNTISNNTCNGNGTSSVYGSGLTCATDPSGKLQVTTIVQHNIIKNNLVKSQNTWAGGGGVLLQGINGIFSDNEVTDNHAIGEASSLAVGGLYFWVPKNGFVIRNNTFLRNAGTKYGGIYLETYSSFHTATILVENNYFIDNAAQVGGAFASHDVPVKLQNNVFRGNQAINNGGAIYMERYQNETVVHLAKMINNSFFNNRANNVGGAIYSYNARPLIINSVFWGDSSYKGREIYIDDSGSPLVEITNSTFNPAFIHGTVVSGGGNLNQDPMFADTLLLTLSPLSNCFDKGTLNYTCKCGNTHTCPLYDIMGTSRPQGLAVDIGAYEYLGVGIDDQQVQTPDFGIANYPNPFSGSTTFTYKLKESAQVHLQVFNNLGLLVAEPVNEFQQNGEHKVILNAEDLPAGIYYCRLQAGNQIRSGKIMKIK
jgi:predicted outer membrane repeat protein